MKESHEMVHLTITNWFNRSGVWTWNIFGVIFKWKIWRVNINITIINCMMNKSPHDIWNHRTGFGRRGPGFEVRFWRLDVSLSWWISWFITMKSVELVHIYSKNWWEEVRATDDAGISLVSNYLTEFTNNILSNVGICNNCM